MKLTWNCPHPECDDVVIVTNFDGYTMSTFRNVTTLHAESHGLPADVHAVMTWMSAGPTWIECDCGIGFGSDFQHVIINVRKHIKLIYHGTCPYCHQPGLPAPALFRALSTAPSCPCGRFIPKGFHIDTGAEK